MKSSWTRDWTPAPSIGMCTLPLDHQRSSGYFLVFSLFCSHLCSPDSHGLIVLWLNYLLISPHSAFSLPVVHLYILLPGQIQFLVLHYPWDKVQTSSLHNYHALGLILTFMPAFSPFTPSHRPSVEGKLGSSLLWNTPGVFLLLLRVYSSFTVEEALWFLKF